MREIRPETSFLLVKLVLMILLNKMYAQDTQMILLPVWNSTDTYNIPLTLKAFGQSIQLNLHRTDHIVPGFDVWKYNTIGVIKKWSQSETLHCCFYVHENDVSFAVINFCPEHGWEGLIFLKNEILEIKPFRENFVSLSLIDNFCNREQVNLSFGKSHCIKKSRRSFNTLNFHQLDNFKFKQRYIRSTQKKLIIELAVFFDKAAYDIFMPFFDNSEEHLRNMILVYVNNIQAMFRNPSFGVPVDISLIRLDIMKRQPEDLPVSDDALKLLDSFCQYAATHNPPDDNDSHHWDIGLYITGIDIYEIENYKKLYNAGKALQNGVCSLAHSCAIVKFGVKNYTLGLASSIVATHEIAHVLGMSHDDSSSIENITGSKMNFSKYEHIMASVENYRGQVTWSQYSRNEINILWRTKRCLQDHTNKKNHVNALDHSRYHDLPGREWTAKAQCELSLRDKDANVVTLHDICQILQCETPVNNSKYVFAGPALDGTHCALGKECRGGECVPVIEPPYIFKYCEEDNWSEWKEDDCQSRCLKESKGVIIKRRSCKHESHRTANCDGPYYAIDLCDDSNICNNRQTTAEFTATKCREFSSVLKTYDDKYLYIPEHKGTQVNHNIKTPWIACTIFCQYKAGDSFYYYSPFLELLDLAIDPYFPDGTWCYFQDDQNYYCRHHYCLPENYSVENNC